jgi:hypothetical protein
LAQAFGCSGSSLIGTLQMSALPVTINNEGVAATIPRQAVVALEIQLV